MAIEIVTKFEFDQPRIHRIPAYDGAQSIQGIARALVLANHYAATGVVRQRAPFESGSTVYLEPLREGSLEAVFQIITDPAVQFFGAVGASIAGAAFYDFAKTIFSRSVGESVDPETEEIKGLDATRSGDFEALVDAIEPALKLGHKAVNNGAININIIHGDNNVVTFNNETKEYVERSITSDIVEEQDISIGSFNANSGYGRAFFHDLQKTVPFTVHRDADVGTKSAITYSLHQYASGLPSDISAQFLRVSSSDGRTKNIILFGATIIE